MEPIASDANLGRLEGESQHRQTIAEIAKHTHSSGITNGYYISVLDEGETDTVKLTSAQYRTGTVMKTSSVGEGLPFSTMQPSLHLNQIIKV